MSTCSGELQVDRFSDCPGVPTYKVGEALCHPKRPGFTWASY